MRLLNQIASITLPATALLTALLMASCEPQSQTAPPRIIPEVSTVTIQTQQIMLTTVLPGRTSAYRVAEIRPQVSGLIQKRLFTEGSEVKAGQLLYQIEPASFEAAVDNASANLKATQKHAGQMRAVIKANLAEITRLKFTLELAQKNRQRYEESYKEKVVSTLQRDKAITEAQVAESTLRAAEAQLESSREAVATAEATIQQAEAALKIAHINLGYTKVTAPISGRIGRSSVTEGAIVTAYQPIALSIIQQIDPIFVDVPQSTVDLLNLRRHLKDGRLNRSEKEQNKVKLRLEDGSPFSQEGTLQFSDITVDTTTGSVILRVLFPNKEGVLLPGMFVQAIIKEGINKQAILVPQQGVARDPKGNPFALIVDAESKVALRMLAIDRAIGDKWLVSSGLASGDRVIVEGLKRLRPGTPVKDVPFEKKGNSTSKVTQSTAESN